MTTISSSDPFAFGAVDQRVIDAAVHADLDPFVVDWHLEAEHGWEPHDKGYEEAIDIAITCVRRAIAAGVEPDKCTLEPDE